MSSPDSPTHVSPPGQADAAGGGSGACSADAAPAADSADSAAKAAGRAADTVTGAAIDTAIDTAIDIDLYDQPGHLFRRAQQISVSMFHEILGSEVTPIQYAILRMLHERPRVDQVTLARLTGLDNSTTATTAARLEAKGLLTREVVSTQRRQRSLLLTRQGEDALAAMVPAVHRLHQSLLGMLPGEEGAELMRLLRKFVHLNNAQSRAPLNPE